MSSRVDRISDKKPVNRNSIINQKYYTLSQENIEKQIKKLMQSDQELKSSLIEKTKNYYFEPYKDEILSALDGYSLVNCFKKADLKSKQIGFKTGVDLALLLLGEPQKYNTFLFTD